MDVLATGVCNAFLLIFFETTRGAEHCSQPWIDRQMRKVRGGVAEIARVVGNPSYAVRGTFRLADLSIGSVLGYLDVRFLELAWRTQYPALCHYMDRLMERPSFRDTMPYPQSINGGVV